MLNELIEENFLNLKELNIQFQEAKRIPSYLNTLKRNKGYPKQAETEGVANISFHVQEMLK